MSMEIVPGLGEGCKPVSQESWKPGTPVHFHLDADAYLRVFVGPSCRP